MGKDMKYTNKFLIGVVAAFALASCGGSSNSEPADSSAAVSVEFNDDDVMFAQMMIPHHEQAIEMSDIALDPTVMAGDEVKALATEIKGAQDPEIQKMTQFLTDWYQSLTMDDSMDHGDMMSGMLTEDQLANLSTLRGAEFDREWMLAMIAHHEGAIEMALAVLQDGKNSAVRDLANSIINAQEAEIAEMRKLLS